MTDIRGLRDLAVAHHTLPAPEERRRLRVNAGITLRTMADHLGITVAAMGALERARKPGEKHLVKYANALGNLQGLEPGTPEEPLTAEEAEQLRKQWEEKACGACGGLHTTALKAPGACPRIKRVVYDAQGRMLEVEYWADGKWPTAGIVWPDEIEAPE